MMRAFAMKTIPLLRYMGAQQIQTSATLLCEEMSADLIVLIVCTELSRGNVLNRVNHFGKK